MFVQRRETGASIDHEQNGVGFFKACFGLFAHAALNGIVEIFLKPRGIDDAEFLVEQEPFGLAPVTRYAGRIIHDRQLLARKAVE